MKLNAEFITKNGQKEFAVLPYQEFLKIQEMLEDLEDILDLREAKQAEYNLQSYSLEEVKQILQSEE